MTTMQLQSLCEISSGGTPSRSNPSNFGGDIPWAKISDIEAANGDLEFTEETLSQQGLEAIRGRVFPKGTLLFAIYGSVGKMAFAGREVSANQAILGLRNTHPHLLNSRYLYRWLETQKSRFGADALGIAQKNLSAGYMRALEISLPPLAEQKRIATILDAADALRVKRRAALAKIDTLAQSIFVEMFGDPIKNPRNWEVRSLDDLIPEERPLTYGILMPGEDVVGGVLYVRVVDMKDGGIDLRGIRRTTPEISAQYKRSILKEGDLLISIRGHVGRTAIVPPELTGANITQDTARIASEECEVEFLQETLRQPAAQEWMARRTKGAAVKGINLGDLRTFPLILPPLKQQQKFAAAARQLRAQKVIMKEQALFTNSLFASLQHRAFRGNLNAVDISEVAA